MAPVPILCGAMSLQGTGAPHPARDCGARSGTGPRASLAELGLNPKASPEGGCSHSHQQPPTEHPPAPSHLLCLPLCPPAHRLPSPFGDTRHSPQAGVGTALHEPPKTPAAPGVAGRGRAGNSSAFRAAEILMSSLDPSEVSCSSLAQSPGVGGAAWAQSPGSPAWEEMLRLPRFKKVRTWLCHHPSPSKTSCFLGVDAEMIKDGDSGTAVPPSWLYLPPLLPGGDEGGHPGSSGSPL